MGLLRSCLETIAPHARNASVLSLGYPDLVVDDGVLSSIFGVSGLPKQARTGFPETAALFERLGSSFKAVDVVRTRGIEEIADLNYPQALGSYDLVLDAGTVEHCFNIGQAMLNAASAVKVGGRIYHTPPLSMVNHGFYNINPTMLYDFYEQNGWKIEHLVGMRDKGRGDEVNLHPTKRYKVEGEMVLHCLARRLSAKPVSFPVQTKYLISEPGTRK